MQGTIERWPKVMSPSQPHQSSSKWLLNLWRDPAIYVIQSASVAIESRRLMQFLEGFPLLLWRAEFRVYQEICLGCQPRKNGHRDFTVFLHNRLAEKVGVAKVRAFVLKTLLGKHFFQRLGIRMTVAAYHWFTMRGFLPPNPPPCPVPLPLVGSIAGGAEPPPTTAVGELPPPNTTRGLCRELWYWLKARK